MQFAAACSKGLRLQIKLAMISVGPGQASSFARLISSSRGISGQCEKLNITCGSSGSITVDLYHSAALSSPSSPLVIHLPPTGHQHRKNQPPIPPYLFSASAALVSINYRWHNAIPSVSPNGGRIPSAAVYNSHPFPTPLHDTLHAYQYLLTTLLPRLSPSPARKQDGNGRTSLYARPVPGTKHVQRPILIYGSFVGGSIATSLALTESFEAKSLPTRIAGLITKNAVFDWTEIATSIAPEQLQREEEDTWTRAPTGWDATTLHALKTHLFTSPASAFDAFASPTQFFRTPGLVVPPSWPVIDAPTPPPTPPSSPIPASSSPSLPDLEDPSVDSDDVDPSSPLLAPDPASESESESVSLLKRLSDMQIEQPTRPAHLKFPSSASGLRIPPSLFLYTPSSPPPPPPPPSSPPPPPPQPNPAEPATPASKSSASATHPAKPKRRPRKLGGEGAAAARQDAEGDISPGGQAKQMAALLRRSVLVHEFASRKVWDETLDPGAASEERVQVWQWQW
ncbi:hypothetical protein LZ554_007627 [Drepanopeziza brunnea f. sp. 'monogermtubi']|nr:hypothetical protein LZ554_007627 [Drepanopeziza brunnea f. sp. 'monogermtubi']